MTQATFGIETSDIPPSFVKKAEIIIRVVQTTRKLLTAIEQEAHQAQKPFRVTPALKQILGFLDPPVGLTSYYKYRALYEQYQGDLMQIAAHFRRATLNQTRMSAAQLLLVDQVILRYGMRHPPRLPRMLYRVLGGVLEHTSHLWIDPEKCEAGIPENLLVELFDHTLPIQAILSNPEKRKLLVPVAMPSESWFYRYWHWFQAQPHQGQAVITARYGPDTWEREMLVFDTFVHHATMPLQYVFADHWLVDVFSVDDTSRREPRRLWLTLLLDAYSRSVLGLALLDEDPSIQSIQCALAHAIWPKVLPETATTRWDCWGIPVQLFLDNAWAHHSHSLEALACAISQGGCYNSIDLVFRPPYQGRYGALIERYFGNLSTHMKTELKGGIVSSRPRDVRKAKAEACLLYEDIDAFIVQEILAYQHTPHRELDGLTPQEKWNEGLSYRLPQVPEKTEAMQRLFWTMSPGTRGLTSKGISAFGMYYTSPALQNAERVNRQGQSIRYRFRYDPLDISRIALFHQEQWVCDVYAKPLRLPDGSYRSLSLAARRTALDTARQAGYSTREWLRFINESDALQTRRQREQKQAGRTARSASQPDLDLQKMTEALDIVNEQARAAERADLLSQFLGE